MDAARDLQLNKEFIIRADMIYTYVTVNSGDAVMFTAIHTLVSGPRCLSDTPVHQK